MAAATKATMIKNKIFLIISSKFDHVELIGDCFGIHGKRKTIKKYLQTPWGLWLDNTGQMCVCFVLA